LEGLYSFLENNAIYIVMIIVLIVWTGIFLYMFGLDKKLKKIEEEIKGVKK
jgi:CcmD family protein